jgi:hypothetical protein
VSCLLWWVINTLHFAVESLWTHATNTYSNHSLILFCGLVFLFAIQWGLLSFLSFLLMVSAFWRFQISNFLLRVISKFFPCCLHHKYGITLTIYSVVIMVCPNFGQIIIYLSTLLSEANECSARHGSLSLLFVKKVMVWQFMSNLHRVMTTLVVV